MDRVNHLIRRSRSHSINLLHRANHAVRSPFVNRRTDNDMTPNLLDRSMVEEEERSSLDMFVYNEREGAKLEKRLTPAQIAAMQAAEQSQAAANQQPAQGAQATTERQAASPATRGTTIVGQQHGQTPTNHAATSTSSYSFFNKFGTNPVPVATSSTVSIPPVKPTTIAVSVTQLIMSTCLFLRRPPASQRLP